MKKEIKNYVFLKNGDFERNLDFFALALPTHVFDPFLSTLFNYCRISVRLPDLNRLVCTSVAGLHWNSLYGGRVNLMMWRMKLGSVPTLNDHGPTLYDHDPTRSRVSRISSILDRLHPIGFSRGGV